MARREDTANFSAAGKLAHALGFGLGSVAVTGSAAPYTYTITPINPATNSAHYINSALELPYFQFVQSDSSGWLGGPRSTLHRLRREGLETRD